MENDIVELRAHHILCTSLFQGKGYSDGFCMGMERMVLHLSEHPEIRIRLVCHPDHICDYCPHLIGKDFCDSNYNHVVTKDQAVMEALELDTESTYSYLELQQQAVKRLNTEYFNKICGDCGWYELGLCSYEKLCGRIL